MSEQNDQNLNVYDDYSVLVNDLRADLVKTNKLIRGIDEDKRDVLMQWLKGEGVFEYSAMGDDEEYLSDYQTSQKIIDELLEKFNNEDKDFLIEMSKGNYRLFEGIVREYDESVRSERNRREFGEYYSRRRREGYTTFEIAKMWGAHRMAEEITNRYKPFRETDEGGYDVNYAIVGSLAIWLLKSADEITILESTQHTSSSNHIYLEKKVESDKLKEIRRILRQWNRMVGDIDVSTWYEKPTSVKYFIDRGIFASQSKYVLEKEGQEEGGSGLLVNAEFRHTHTVPGNLILVGIGGIKYPILAPSDSLAMKFLQIHQRPDKLQKTIDDTRILLGLAKVFDSEEIIIDRVRKVYLENEPKPDSEETKAWYLENRKQFYEKASDMKQFFERVL